MLTAALPVRVYWRRANPTPIPDVALPEPNGYDDLLKAAKLLTSPILEDPDAAPRAALQAEVAKHQQMYDLVRLGLSRQTRVPLRYDVEFDLNNLEAMRSLARALTSQGHSARYDQDFDRAAAIYADNPRLGAASSQGGLMLDGLVGNAIEGIGLGELQTIVGDLSAESCRRVIDVLWQVDGSWSPPEDFIKRDRIWEEHAMGWQGRFGVVLREVAGVEGGNDDGFFDDAFIRAMQGNRVQCRLLMTTLALRAYRLDTGELPTRLEELTPAYLPAVPRDPFTNGPLVYRPTDDGYLLYSVGPDGVDDGGQRIARDEYFYYAEDQPGDVFLETFAAEEQPAAASP